MMKRQSHIDANYGHVLIVGMTGSGKSVLETALITESNRAVLVGDPKGDFEWPQAERAADEFMRPVYAESSAELLKLNQYKRIIFRPKLALNENPDEWARFFQYGFRRKRTRICIDEVYHITDLRGDALAWYNRVLTRGRSSEVFMTMCSQRPTRIPLGSLTEAMHTFVFQLHYHEDRKRLAANVGREEFLKTPQDAFREYYAKKGWSQSKINEMVESDPIKYGFWYYRTGAPTVQLFTAVNYSDREGATATDIAAVDNSKETANV